MKIVVGMSGGVDSSVTAYLLKKQGHEVLGLFMNQQDKQTELSDAKKVCELIGIPFEFIDYQKEFQEKVVQKYQAEQARGATPNPCCWCNPNVKFKCLLDYADSVGAKFVATGHYANIIDGQLCRALDSNKDQSYFLCGLSKEQMARIIFPLGKLTKPEVRAIAKEIGLPVHDKPDSNDMCFSVESKNLTIGQRMKIGGQSEKLYYLGNGKVGNGSSQELYLEKLTIKDFNFMMPFENEIRCTAKVRYRQHDQSCTAKNIGGNIEVIFDAPVRAITSGQWCVLYDGDKVIGGGEIQ